jgi:transcriptional regulator with XRE-family HTH domain
MDRLLEVRDDIRLEHESMLTIVSSTTQPCIARLPLTLVDMKDWKDCKDLGERLAWSLERSQVSRAQLAEACGVSTAAISKWLSNDTKNLKSENLFTAAELCVVNAKWLATGRDTPFTGIPAAYTQIAGPDLQIARELSELGDKKLRDVISELIKSKQSAAQERAGSRGSRRSKAS